MIRILLIFCLATISNIVYSQANSAIEENRETLSSFIKEYRNNKDIKIVEIGSAMTEMLAARSADNGNDSNAKLLRSIESITIIADASDNTQLQEGMFKLPHQFKGLKLISSINDMNNTTAFYFGKDENTKICEFLMLVENEEKNIMLYIIGEFSVKDISTLSSLSNGISKQ